MCCAHTIRWIQMRIKMYSTQMAWPHYLVQYQVSRRDENCLDACPEPWACNGADNNTHLHDVDGTVVELPIGSKSYYSTSCNQGIAVDLLLQPRQEMLTIAPEVNACMHDQHGVIPIKHPKRSTSGGCVPVPTCIWLVMLS